MLACGIQFVSVIVRLFNTALFDTSRTTTQAHSKTLSLSNERNLTFFTACCKHLQTARMNLDSIECNNKQVSLTAKIVLVLKEYSKDYGINTENLPTTHLFRFLASTFHISDKYVRLGSSCLPHGLLPCNKDAKSKRSVQFPRELQSVSWRTTPYISYPDRILLGEQ